MKICSQCTSAIIGHAYTVDNQTVCVHCLDPDKDYDEKEKSVNEVINEIKNKLLGCESFLKGALEPWVQIKVDMQPESVEFLKELNNIRVGCISVALCELNKIIQSLSEDK